MARSELSNDSESAMVRAVCLIQSPSPSRCGKMRMLDPSHDLLLRSPSPCSSSSNRSASPSLDYSHSRSRDCSSIPGGGFLAAAQANVALRTRSRSRSRRGNIAIPARSLRTILAAAATDTVGNIATPARSLRTALGPWAAQIVAKNSHLIIVTMIRLTRS